MPKQYSIAEARSSLPSLVHAVEAGPPVELTRRGRSVAVLLSATDFARLQPRRPDLWAAIETFRRETDLEELDVDAILEDVRDRSPGREPEL
jgi:prevent-host-death family protein